jgi:hypothetical protein
MGANSLTVGMVFALGEMGAKFARGALPASTSPKVPMATSNVASPNLSEFKSYWSARETDSKKRTKQNKDKDSDDEDDLVPFAALKERTRMKGPTGGGDKSPALQVPLHRPDNVSNDE